SKFYFSLAEVPPDLVPLYRSYLEELNERRRNLAEEVRPLQLDLELGRRDVSGSITTIRQEDQPSGDVVPEIEETPTISTRGITGINKCQEMINMISKYTPRSLSVNASKRTCCIFKVPHTFVGNSYHPSVVSIGPYHRGMTQFMMIEEHKWRYLKSLLCRKQTKTFEDYLESIEPLEKDAREYYSEIIQLKSHEFIEMMVLDGCFMIEVFRKIKDPRQFEAGDPLLTVGWILPFLYTDFLLLENQIPFFILEMLFEISKMPSEESSLSLLAMQFFNEATALRRADDFICRFHDLKGWHLLDLVRLSFVPEEEITQSNGILTPKEEITQSSGTPTHIMHSISKLHGSGIKLNLAKAESFLVVKFKNGGIEMPRIRLDELMGSFLSNCVAFEQCHCDVSKHFTTYATFLGVPRGKCPGCWVPTPPQHYGKQSW
ncbi:hypothetical protein I3843_10G122700, partial [Carya illinoinensis]